MSCCQSRLRHQDIIKTRTRSRTGSPVTHRLHKVEHLSLLDLLDLEDVVQRRLVELLPHPLHLGVSLGEGEGGTGETGRRVVGE